MDISRDGGAAADPGGAPAGWTADDGAPSAGEVRAALASILESGEFRTARNRARFLSYVVTRTLDRSGDDLKEYTIGLEVFERGANFDPRTDGVVRTQAGLVRKHLERYYANQGRADTVEIVLPKGHYIPQFRRREAFAVPPGDTSPARSRQRWMPVSAGAAAVLAVVLAIAWLRGIPLVPAEGAQAEAGDRGRPIWDAFLRPGASNVLAFGIPQFFTGAGGIWVRDVDVNSPSIPAGNRLEAIGKAAGGSLESGEAYTGIGEAYGVHVLTRFFLKSGAELRVIRSHGVSWDNLKHDNVIFLTSARFRTLADEMSVPAEFVHVLGAPNRVVNRHPAPGEQSEYMARSEAGVYVDYAIISVAPAKLPGRRVVILSGGHTWGTQAAAEYVTEPAYLTELKERLLACQRSSGLARHPEFFQVLLQVETRSGEPLGATFVTHRDLALQN
jgi:hypothetical protein